MRFIPPARNTNFVPASQTVALSIDRCGKGRFLILMGKIGIHVEKRDPGNREEDDACSLLSPTESPLPDADGAATKNAEKLGKAVIGLIPGFAWLSDVVQKDYW